MHHLVALSAELEDGRTVYFVTWGRVLDDSNISVLESVVKQHSSKFRTGSPVLRMTVCDSLSDARNAPRFYESLFDFASDYAAPFRVEAFEEWRKLKRDRLLNGYEIAFIGPFPQ